jgi:glucose-6-phosphate 1-epimerase
VDKSQELSQFKGDDYQRMMCVETANAVNDVFHLEPGENYKLVLTVSDG